MYAKKEKALNEEALITYKRRTTVGQLLTNYRSLADREASSQQQRGYSGPCGHCVVQQIWQARCKDGT